MTTTQNKIPQLRFNEFAEPWEEKRLGDIGSFKNGLNKDKNDFGFGYPFVNLMDVFGKSSISQPNLGLVNANDKDLKLYNLKQGDVLFIRSSVKREGVGETTVVLEDLNNTVYSGFLIRFRDSKRALSLRYKAYCFFTLDFRKKLLALSTTSANTNINQDSLCKIKIAIPSLPEQEKIAAFLGSVDERVSQLTKKKELLEKYKRGVMQKIFNQDIRFKDDNGNDFPNWQQKKLGEILKLTIREVPKPDKPYEALGVRSHNKGTFHKFVEDPLTVAMDKLYLVKPNDLIVSITFAWEHAIAVASDGDAGRLVSHRFPTFIAKDSLNMSFFRSVVANKRFKYMLGLISPGGAGRNRVMSKKDFIKLKVTIPCLEEQNKIAEFLTALNDKLELAERELDKAHEFKKGLLQRMFV